MEKTSLFWHPGSTFLSLGGATKKNVKLGNVQQCTAIWRPKMAMNIWIDHVFRRLPRNVPAMVFQLRTCWPPHHVLAGHLCVEPRDTWYGPKMESQPIWFCLKKPGNLPKTFHFCRENTYHLVI
jgi:hypothetical protein